MSSVFYHYVIWQTSGKSLPNTSTCLAPGTDTPEAPSASGSSDELGDALTPYAGVIGFNNFYEFTTSKRRSGTESRLEWQSQAMTIHDISLPISETLIVWPGDP
ncbi:MAG: hypothetical protein H8D78_20835, partial [Chloroflexi bacterium]|nr:hypothetical protein [Chloroflexota bacterium]